MKRICGKDRYRTNMAVIKEAGFAKESDNSVFVCTGKGYADSLAASSTGLPVFLVGDKLTAEQKQFIKNNHIKWFYVLGGEGVISNNLTKELQDTVFDSETYHPAVELTRRLAGANRIATSVVVAKEYQGKNVAPLKKDIPNAVVLAYAHNYADGITGGAFAEAIGAPIILIDNKTESINQIKAYLTEMGIENIYVLGGSGLISNSTVRALK